MNDAQKHNFDLIMSKVYHKQSDIFFVDGPGGTGKSFLFNSLLNKIRSEGKIAIAVASSGIAATLLENGRTAHSRFKISLEVFENSSCNISIQSD